MFQGVCWKILRDDFLQLFRWWPVRDDAGIDIGGMDIAFPEDASEGGCWAKVAWKSQGFFSMYEVLVVGLYTSGLIIIGEESSQNDSNKFWFDFEFDW